MNTDPSLPTSSSGRPADPPALPELNTSLLDLAQVEQLLRDIEVCTQITEIIPKHGARSHVSEEAGITLMEARQLLRERSIRGLQLRYRYEGADWWDTLMVAGEQFRLIRIRHDFSELRKD